MDMDLPQQNQQNPTKPRFIIGVDPPVSANCGWSVVSLVKNGKEDRLVLHEKFTQKLDKANDGDKVLQEVYAETGRLLLEYEPEALCMERQLGGGFQFGRAKLNEFVGVIKLCCWKHRVKVIEVSPAHLKMIIAGYGQAPKEYIMKNIALTFGLQDSGEEHECDAAAFAVTYFIDNGWTGYEVKAPFTKEMALAIKADKKARKLKREENKKAKEAKAAEATKKAKVRTANSP